MCPEEIRLSLEDTEDFSFDPTSADSFDLGIADLRDEAGLQYPALLLSGVAFMDCLRVLDVKKRKSYREVDVWVEIPNGGFSNIGTLQLDSDMLLLLHFLRIRAVMYYDRDTIEPLDLSDPSVIEKFV